MKNKGSQEGFYKLLSSVLVISDGPLSFLILSSVLVISDGPLSFLTHLLCEWFFKDLKEVGWDRGEEKWGKRSGGREVGKGNGWILT